MKTLILAMAMMVGVTMSAQPGNGRHRDGKHMAREQREQLTPEQRSELKAKHMALALDLNDKQQKEVQKLMLTQAQQRQQFMSERKANKEAGKKPTADERFAMQNKMLDNRIAMKRELKKILTEEQYKKFAMQKNRRHEKIGKHAHNIKKHNRR